MGAAQTPFDLMFREYDIRGRVNDAEMCPDNVYKIIRAFAVFLRKRGIRETVVGHDLRSYSPSFARAAIDALVDGGCTVYDIGLSLSPVAYFAQYHLDCESVVMITASHNPDGWSGFKLGDGKSTTLGPDGIRELKEIVDSAKFVSPSSKGKLLKRRVREAYIEKIVSSVNLNPDFPMTVAVDCANGGAGLFAWEVFQRIGCRVFQLYCDPDDRFPNYSPNPSDLKARERLAQIVTHPYIDADIGIGFDGDGDRIGVIDGNGENVWSDKVLLLLACQLLEKKKGATVVFDVKCTRLLPDEITARGGRPLMWKTGHSHIKSKMHEAGADLAGERSGHIFIGGDDYYGFDDAIFTAAKLLEYLSHEKKPINEILQSFPRYETSPEIKAHCADEVKYSVVERLVREFTEEYGGRVDDTNGARVTFDDGWGLVRASSNLPELVIIFEARTPEGLRRIRTVFRDKMARYPEIDPDWHNDIAE